MRLDYTRQTRWGHDPEPADPPCVPPGTIYVKQIVWAPCTECDLQVHFTLSQALAGGVACPVCGGRLTSPRVLGNPDVAAARILEVEEILRDGLFQESAFAGEVE